MLADGTPDKNWRILEAKFYSPHVLVEATTIRENMLDFSLTVLPTPFLYRVGSSKHNSVKKSPPA